MQKATMHDVAMQKGVIHIGTSGWVYPHWREVFYPRTVPQRLWLQYYAQHFEVTEINASFYRLPSQAAVENWVKSAGPAFFFCPKISRFITHAKKLNDPEQAVPRFFDVFGVVAEHLGPVLIQLPASLAFHAEKAEKFFEFLSERYGDFSYSLEARHESWAKAEPVALLKRYGIGWVIGESGRRFASAELVTAPHVYLRFHGPDGTYATPYTPKMLEEYAGKCRGWRRRGYTVWVFFNNDVHGYAIENALSLKQMVS
ncbi:MAG TPA: DUF72 domain-containing protein [Puia sp.]|nr:DUF72 domain-containing protein [Puia sp.]